MREEKTISSRMACGRKWFFPPAWCPLEQYLVSTELLINFFYTSGLLMAPLENGRFPNGGYSCLWAQGIKVCTYNQNEKTHFKLVLMDSQKC